ncbi:hypothetical protein V501_03877 [Pseudogymnoascus sp. VKM F-4519 (FW-2642)]|nr:hypothetical protein V501_03877 [Pseudogymnoascus sp. VKM F-4519 (FW-2642)]
MRNYVLSVVLGLLSLGALLDRKGIATADNPIIQTIYTADPAPFVHNGRMYLFVDHDNNNASVFDMTNWHLFSTIDMANWQDHGEVMSLATFSWSISNAWAGQVIERNNKFYYYAPMQSKDGGMAIGVGVSNNILGPYTDALGKPLVDSGGFDPSRWSRTTASTPRGGINTVNLTTAGFGVREGNEARPTTFEEAPWIYQRKSSPGSPYYLVYAANCCAEDIRYSMGPTITGPWTYQGVIMPAQGRSFTNHPAMIDYRGHSYFFYHNGGLPGGDGFQRSVCVEEFRYNANGTIPAISMTSAGVDQIAPLDPYVRQEAETNAWSWGLSTEVSAEGGMYVTNITNGDYIKVKGVDFGRRHRPLFFSARVASAGNGGSLELRLGGATGTLVGKCPVSNTGSSQTWTTVTCAVHGATGTQDLYFVFTGGSGNLFNFDYWQFRKTGNA